MRAGRGRTPGAGRALAALCENYWFPLYAFVRRAGHAAEDAQDLTQAFFAELLAKNVLAVADPQRGKFRSFLLGGDQALSGQRAPTPGGAEAGRSSSPAFARFRFGRKSLSPDRAGRQPHSGTAVRKTLGAGPAGPRLRPAARRILGRRQAAASSIA